MILQMSRERLSVTFFYSTPPSPSQPVTPKFIISWSPMVIVFPFQTEVEVSGGTGWDHPVMSWGTVKWSLTCCFHSMDWQLRERWMLIHTSRFIPEVVSVALKTIKRAWGIHWFSLGWFLSLSQYFSLYYLLSFVFELCGLKQGQTHTVCFCRLPFNGSLPELPLFPLLLAALYCARLLGNAPSSVQSFLATSHTSQSRA